jgi:hypothetical protein
MDPDPTPDPILSSVTLRMHTIFFSSYFFFLELTRRHPIFSLSSVVDPDPHQSDKLDPDQIAYVKPKCMEYEPI